MENENSFIKHAKRELTDAGLFDKTADYGGLIGKEVMEMIHVFDKAGHSGVSANIVADVFHKLATWGILTPLTEENADWQEISDGCKQSCKISSVFKDKKGIYYLDAITWVGENNSFVGKVEGVFSRQYIKSLPFSPKNFRINVKTINGTSVIKDKSSLINVADYYNMDLSNDIK